jgi:hypothetical protein
MVKPLRTDKFEIETGHDFAGWIKFLDAAAARNLSHGEIVGKIETVPDVSSWWAQSVAVAYEQHIGRRLPGQRSDGTFYATLSRALASGAETARTRWIAMMDGEAKVAGRKLAAEPTTTDTRSGLNWRCKLDDGAKVTVNFLETKPGKTQAAVEHDGLASPEAIDRAKDYWAGMFEKLKTRLDGPAAAPVAEMRRAPHR